MRHIVVLVRCYVRLFEGLQYMVRGDREFETDCVEERVHVRLCGLDQLSVFAIEVQYLEVINPLPFLCSTGAALDSVLFRLLVD